MKKKISAVMLSVALMASSLAGCGSTTEETQARNTDAADAKTENTTQKDRHLQEQKEMFQLLYCVDMPEKILMDSMYISMQKLIWMNIRM